MANTHQNRARLQCKLKRDWEKAPPPFGHWLAKAGASGYRNGWSHISQGHGLVGYCCCFNFNRMISLSLHHWLHMTCLISLCLRLALLGSARCCLSSATTTHLGSFWLSLAQLSSALSFNRSPWHGFWPSNPSTRSAI